jgi:hypothetical protein
MLKPTTVILAAALALTACSRTRPVGADEYNDYAEQNGNVRGRLFGDSSIVLGAHKANGDSSEQGAALGVNAYLWRGALDTLGFMPLASADPFGGVIITDWYQPPASEGERFKATAYILGRQLRADGIKVSLFRQVLRGNQWVDAPVSPVTTGEIENKVLARARELRSQTAAR